MSADFDLRGSPDNGALSLFGPFGTTLAELQWSPTSAQLKRAGESRYFDSLSSMVAQTSGMELPIEQIFAWLEGQTVNTPEWQVDVSRRAQGRITAHKPAPPPAIDLQLILEP